MNYTVASRGFKHLVHGNLTESESKNYTSKNILLNLKQLFEAVPQLDLQVKKELMVRINSIEKEVLR